MTPIYPMYKQIVVSHLLIIDPNFRAGTSKSLKKRPKRPNIFLNLYQTSETSWSFIASSISFHSNMDSTPISAGGSLHPLAPPMSRAPTVTLKSARGIPERRHHSRQTASVTSGFSKVTLESSNFTCGGMVDVAATV